jgi:ribosome-binding factor A
LGGSRLDRINEEIMRELSALIRRLKDPRVQGLVSVTHVETTPDMRYAKVFISCFGDDRQAESCVKGLSSAAGFLRRELGASLKLRYTPELIFKTDNSINRAFGIMELMNKIAPDKEAHDG